MNYVILLAGGIGNRVGAGIPKQFVDVYGKPVIAYTMECFQSHPEIDAIELVCVDGFQSQLKEIVDSNHISKVIKIVKGGAEYENSIMNGVEGLRGIANPDDLILIHWAAAPFVTSEIISDNIRVCKAKGNAMSASPAYLLYGTNDGECALHNINRDTTVVENVEGVKILVFLVLRRYLYTRQTLLQPSLAIATDGSREVERLSPTVWHIVGSSEIRQIAHKRVAFHLHRITIRQHLALASHRVHHTHINLVMPVGQCCRHFTDAGSLTFGLFGCGGTSSYEEQGH